MLSGVLKAHFCRKSSSVNRELEVVTLEGGSGMDRQTDKTTRQDRLATIVSYPSSMWVEVSICAM